VSQLHQLHIFAINANMPSWRAARFRKAQGQLYLYLTLRYVVT